MLQPGRPGPSHHPRTLNDALGLIGFGSVAALQNLLLIAVAARRRATAAHPRSAGGFNAWSEFVAAVREYLSAKGWTLDDCDNLPRAISPTGEVALVVYSGDELTGQGGLAQPRTRSDKGRTALAAIRMNVENDGQLVLEGFEPEDRVAEPVLDTYAILFYIDDERDEVRAEIGRPVGMASDRHIDTWRPAFQLPPLLLNSSGPNSNDDGPDDEGGIDVPVRRR